MGAYELLEAFNPPTRARSARGNPGRLRKDMNGLVFLDDHQSLNG